jgi:2-polyprenyl-3-methyl-5-hydroxy-6-metoxy-1,4-benzoquinol methylase
VTAIERDAARAAAGAASCEHMVVADLDRATPELEGRFDAIVYGDVLEHLADPLATLVSLDRSLATDGDVVISVPNVAHLWIRLSLLLGRFDYTERGILDRSHLRFFTERTFRALVADAGLRIHHLDCTPAPLPQVVPSALHGPWLGVVHAASAAAARRLPRLLAYQFVVLARPA